MPWAKPLPGVILPGKKALLDRLVTEISALDGLYINGCHEAPHFSLSVPGVPTQNTINIFAGQGHLRFRRVRLRQGPPEPCADGHESLPERMDGSFGVPVPGHHLGGVGSAARHSENDILPRRR